MTSMGGAVPMPPDVLHAAGAVHEVIGGNKIVRVRSVALLPEASWMAPPFSVRLLARISRPSLALSPTATVCSNTTLAPLLLLLL